MKGKQREKVTIEREAGRGEFHHICIATFECDSIERSLAFTLRSSRATNKVTGILARTVEFYADWHPPQTYFGPTFALAESAFIEAAREFSAIVRAIEGGATK